MQMITIELSQLTFDTPLQQSGESLALATLVLPRPGIRQKTALKPFRLQKGKARLSRKPFYEKALLKEKVDGRFGLTLQLTRPTKHGEFQAMMRALAGLGLETAGDLLASGLSTNSLRPLLREPFDVLADHLTDDAPDFVLEGGIDLRSENLRTGSLTLPLQLSRRLRISDLPPGPKSREKRKTAAKTYKKGLTVGEAVLKVSVE